MTVKFKIINKTPETLLNNSNCQICSWNLKMVSGNNYNKNKKTKTSEINASPPVCGCCPKPEKLLG